METMARKVTAIAPDVAYGYILHAQALAGQNGSPEAVAHLLQEKRSHMRVGREEAERLDPAILAYREGNFTASLAALDTQGAGSAGRKNAAEMGLRVAIFTEMGREALAATEAESWLRFSAALPLPERPSDSDVGFFLAAARRGGAITTRVFQQRRDQVVEGWRKRLDPHANPKEFRAIWLDAYGFPASPEEAIEAVAGAADFGGLPAPLDSGWSTQGDVGETLRLAGRLADAIPYLEQRSHQCTLTPNVQSWLRLGKAEEARGATEKACRAYDAVIGTWDKARPRSVSVEDARARRKKLGCRGGRGG